MEQKEKNKRKLLLLLPLLLLPFAALIFYAFGGGKTATADSKSLHLGLNTSLPGAQLKGRQTKDKLALYDQAERDSAAAKAGKSGDDFAALGWDTAGFGKGKVPVNSAQASEAKITQKLAEINRQIHWPEQPTNTYPAYAQADPASAQMDRLEKVLKQKPQPGAPDPEMQQLNAMLEKIENIQHPERAGAQAKKVAKAEPDSIYKAFRAVIVKKEKVKTGDFGGTATGGHDKDQRRADPQGPFRFRALPGGEPAGDVEYQRYSFGHFHPAGGPDGV